MRDSTCTKCPKPALAKGLCRVHYRDVLADKNNTPCRGRSCARAAVADGVCLMHYKRIRRTGSIDRQPPQNLGPSDILAGYVRVTHGGYIRLTQYTPKVVRVMEHRAVMESILGRPLLPQENVHHINGVRDDNRPENLELWSSSQPSGQRVTDKVAWAREILELYGD